MSKSLAEIMKSPTPEEPVKQVDIVDALRKLLASLEKGKSQLQNLSMYDLKTIKWMNTDEQIRIRQEKARILNRASKEKKQQQQ